MTNMEEREKRAKEKARKVVIFFDIYLLAMWIFAIVFTIAGGPINNKELVIGFSIIHFIIAIICIGGMIVVHKKVFKFLVQDFIKQEERNESENTVQYKLSTKKYVEVLPIKPYKHKEFILGLTDRAQFYAIIKDDIVSISIKFNDGEELHHWENIYAEDFNKCYQIK